MPDEPTSSFILIVEGMLVNDVGSEQLLLTLGRSSGPDVTPAKATRIPISGHPDAKTRQFKAAHLAGWPPGECEE
ncbi:hypothetical protein GCM10017322_40310 [Paracoccus aerius]|nr:hypothetical protein GCM10017322_40310 [Paracoccus aerius]